MKSPTRVLFFSFKNASYFSKEIKKLQEKPLYQKMRQRLFSKYLLITNVLVSMGFSGVGDITEQMFEIRTKYQDIWNWRRTVKLTLTGLPVGLVCHYWYIFLDKRFYQNTHSVIAKKVLLSQLVFSPVCILVFFGTLGCIDRASWAEVKNNLATKGKRIYLVEWTIWPPASLVNFYFVPLKYRVLYDNIVSFGFDVYNSYIVHRYLKTASPSSPLSLYLGESVVKETSGEQESSNNDK